MHLIEESTCMNSSRLPLLETLFGILLELIKWGQQVSIFGEYCLLHNFGQMRSNDDRSDVI
jgi:hypothetical protein